MTVAELRQNALTVLVEPDPLITPSTLISVLGGASDSTYTQAAPIPGPAVFQQANTGTSPTLGTRSPDLRVVTSGTQATTQGIVVTRAGMPGQSLDVAAMILDDGEPRWHGWSQPHVLESLSASVLDAGAAVPHNMAAVETADGRVLFVWANSTIKGRRYDPRTRTWDGSAVLVLDNTLDMSADEAAWRVENVVGAVRLRSDRLLCIGIRSTGELVTAFSDDHGLTWRTASLSASDRVFGVYGDAVLALSAAYDRVRDAVLVVVTAQYLDGQDVRVGWAQLASTDLGASFSLVEWWGDGDTPAGPDAAPCAVVADPTAGGFVVAHVRTSAADTLCVQRIGSPHLPLREADVEEVLGVGAAGAAPDQVQAWADQQGCLWIAVCSAASPAAVRVLRSLDGVVWVAQETPLHCQLAGVVDRLVACPVGAEVVWALGSTTDSVRPDQVWYLAQSGGWQQLCQPRHTFGYPYELRAWARSWLPWTDPATAGWTLTGTSGVPQTTGAPRLVHGAAAGSYAVAWGATDTSGAIVHAHLGSVSASLIAAEVFIAASLQNFGVVVRFSSGGLRVIDSGSGLQVGTDYSWGGGSYTHHVRLGITQYRVAVYHRRHDLDRWTLAVEGALVLSATTPGLSWGQASGAGASTWYQLHYTEQDGQEPTGTVDVTTDALSSGVLLARAWQSLPGALLPGPSARLPLWEGLRVHGAAGPGLRGESWLVEVDDQHAAEHVLSRAVAERWESADTSAQRLVWEPAAGQVHHPGGHSVAVAVFGANIRTATLQGWDGAAWVDVAALDLGLSGCAYTRSGDTVRVASGGTAHPLLRAQDLVGATILLDSTHRRAIASATGGVWGTGSAPATLRLSGVTGAEPTSGTATILLTQGAAVRLGHVTGYTRWGLLIPSQNTVSGTFRIGRAVIGTAHVLGQQPSWGRVETQEVQADTYEVPGLTRARPLARTRRRWRLGWVEGVISRRGQTSPSYTAAGGVGQVVAGDVSAIDALTDSYGMGLGQLAYLPRVAHTHGAASPETILCLGRDACVLATLRGAPQTEQVLGVELGVELLRVSEVEIEEEP